MQVLLVGAAIFGSEAAMVGCSFGSVLGFDTYPPPWVVLEKKNIKHHSLPTPGGGGLSKPSNKFRMRKSAFQIMNPAQIIQSPQDFSQGLF